MNKEGVKLDLLYPLPADKIPWKAESLKANRFVFEISGGHLV